MNQNIGGIVKNAAEDLVDKDLPNGWKVIERIQRDEDSTGGFFSVCYKVQKNDEICFLKAFNLSAFLDLKPEDGFIDNIYRMSNAYKYEKDLSELCKNQNIKNVVYVKDSGEAKFPNYDLNIVPYLIFDLADGDVRSRIKFSDNLDYIWKLGSLHKVAVGLKQLHGAKISHQDLKPSNILLFNEHTKIGDLGSSLCQTIEGPNRDYFFSGDWAYAPPEILYSYCIPDWKKKAFATDCYLLGNLIVFYFVGLNMTVLMKDQLFPKFNPDYWTGDYYSIMSYLKDAFYSGLQTFKSAITHEFLRENLGEMVEHLCHPDPEERGNPKNKFSGINQYNLDKYVTKLNYLQRVMKVELSRNG